MFFYSNYFFLPIFPNTTNLMKNRAFYRYINALCNFMITNHYQVFTEDELTKYRIKAKKNHGILGKFSNI